MTGDQRYRLNWIKLGIVAGLVATVCYPSLILIDLPTPLTVAVAFGFAAGLALGSMGLYHALSWEGRRILTEIAVVSNIIAASMLLAMVLSQMAVGITRRDLGAAGVNPATFALVNSVQLALDVVWDLCIGLGTVLFGAAMWRHGVAGRVLGTVGVLAAAALLALNVWTFPVPPGEAELIDLGPIVGTWYLAVTIWVWSLLGRLKQSQ